jgi:hypothetical protein
MFLDNKKWWMLMGGLWLMFWIVGVYRLDPDFGWHVRIGQMIRDRGIPKTDPFSYTMPSFRWVDHGLGSDVLLGYLYPVWGSWGLAALFATLVVMVWVVVVPGNLRKWALIPVLLSAAVLSMRSGVRPQVQDWLYLAIILRWWEERRWWKKWRGLVPVFFGYWANMHGGWAVGLGVLAVLIGWDWWRKAKRDYKDVATWIMGVLATLVTPYGFGLWHEVWLTVSDGNLKWSIAEWQPFFFSLEFGFLIAAVCLVMFGWYQRGRVDSRRLVVAGLTFVAGLSSLRHGALFAVAMVPALAMVLKSFYEDFASKGDEVEGRLKIFYKVLTVVAVVVFGLEVAFRTYEVYLGIKGDVYYPVAAVEELKKLNPEGNLFTEYGWGGYVLWKYPERKLFVDGRMPSWRYNVWGCDLKIFGEKCNAPDGESEWAFKDYLEVADKGNFEDLFNKYDVRIVVWPRSKNGKGFDLSREIERFFKMVGWADNTKKQGFIEKLTQSGWERVFEDVKTEIYIKSR